MTQPMTLEDVEEIYNKPTTHLTCHVLARQLADVMRENVELKAEINKLENEAINLMRNCQ